MKIQPVIIGIDPGVSQGCIAVLDNGKLIFHKMKENFMDIVEILKKYGGTPDDNQVRCSIEKLSSRPLQNPFIAKRMEPMIKNFNDIKNALEICNIRYQEVAPRTWQKYEPLNLIVDREKGIDYELFIQLKRELITLDLNYSNLSKKELTELRLSYEKDIEKIKRKETQIRKKRYQEKAKEITGDDKLQQWKADALLILVYQKYNM